MTAFRASELVPAVFVVENVAVEADTPVILISGAANCRCPLCGAVSGRIHSRYERNLMNLPVAGRRTRLVLRARRFFCDESNCAPRVFTYRFDANVEPRARRTIRLDDVVHGLVIASGGKSAAALSRRLSVCVSNDTLLRLVRRHSVPEFQPPSIVGIDAWAWRRNHRHGTLICDLERRRQIALLPDREPARSSSREPSRRSLALDGKCEPSLPRRCSQKHAANPGGDRRRHDPAFLMFAERLQYEGCLQREETNASILSLSQQAAAIKEIVRRTDYSRGTIRKILRGQRSGVFRTRSRSVEPYPPWLDARWAAGRRNGAALWRALRDQSFRGCLGVVSEWSARRKRAETMTVAAAVADMLRELQHRQIKHEVREPDAEHGTHNACPTAQSARTRSSGKHRTMVACLFVFPARITRFF